MIEMTTAETLHAEILSISSENIDRLNSVHCRAATSSRLYVKYKKTR
jgi:hypothetical protein